MNKFACAALLALLPITALAQDVQPGLWEIVMEVRADNTPGFQPAPYSLSQCFTQADTRNPEQLLGKYATPGASSCTYTRKLWIGNNFAFSMQCSGSFGLTVDGQITVNPTSFNGSMTSTAKVIQGETTRFNSRIHAQRKGNC